MCDALLDYVRGELVLRKLQHLAAYACHQSRAVFRCPVLQHMLHHVIAVLVLLKRRHMSLLFVKRTVKAIHIHLSLNNVKNCRCTAPYLYELVGVRVQLAEHR